MASTYSTNLAIELIGTGEQSGTWGATTNTNLGTLLEQAISGYVTQAITDGSGANTTITIPNGATGVARNMFIEMTGALTFSTTSLIVPANKKMYFIFNNTTGGFAVTVKVSGQTGILVPNGKKVVLTCNGTDIVEAHTAIVGNATMGGTLGVTGATTLSSTLGVTSATTLSSTVSFTGSTFTLDEKSNTAFATPSALSATGYRAFASTVSGAAMMGFGTTNDVSLMNRAGTVVLGVGPNTTLVNIPAALTVGTTLGITGTTTAAAINASGTVAMAGAATVGTTLAVTGATTLSSTLDVTGTSTLAAVNASGAVGIASGLTFSQGGVLATTYGDGNSLHAVVKNTTNAGSMNLRYGTASVKSILYANDSSGDGNNAGIGTTSNHTFSLLANGVIGLTLTPSGNAVTIPGTLGVTGQVTQSAAQVHKAAADMGSTTYSVGTTDLYLMSNQAGTTTVTLGTATAGRMLYFGTLSAQSVISASSNVIPLGSDATGTAILPATDGAWAIMQGDGSNWRVLMRGVP